MKPRTLLFVGIGIVAFILGFVFLRGPTPHITIAAEELTTVGPVKLTNTMITSWFVVILTIVFFFFFATRRWSLVPSGLQNFVEAALEAFYNLVVNVAGEKNGRRFFPVVATIFLYVVISNWLSLTPIFNSIGFHSPEEEHGFVMEQMEIGPIDLTYVLSGPGALSADSIDEDDPDHKEQAEKAKADGKFVGELIPVFRGSNTDRTHPRVGNRLGHRRRILGHLGPRAVHLRKEILRLQGDPSTSSSASSNLSPNW